MLKNSFQFGELIIKRKLTSDSQCKKERRSLEEKKLRKKEGQCMKKAKFEAELVVQEFSPMYFGGVTVAVAVPVVALDSVNFLENVQFLLMQRWWSHCK